MTSASFPQGFAPCACAFADFPLYPFAIYSYISLSLSLSLYIYIYIYIYSHECHPRLSLLENL